MKILQINVTVNSGSTGRIVEQIGEVIINNHSDSYIAYSRLGLPSRSKIIKIGNKLDIYKHVFVTRLFDKHGFASKKATNDLIKEIDIIKPDIVHLHNIHGYYLHISNLFNYFDKKKVRLVWTFHDCWPFTGHCSYFDRVDCNKWKTECYECPLKSYYPTSWFLDNSKNNFELKKNIFANKLNLTVVTPSKWLKKLGLQSFFKNDRIEVINNGIDLSIFNPTKSTLKTKYGIQKFRTIIGVANIWDSRKGLNDFIQLSKLLDNEVKIILVGLNKKQLKIIPSNIIGIKRTENIQELVELYSMADIFVNPTYSDNFPTTNIEALACGTPVITYNTGGSPEAVDSNTGIVVDQGNTLKLKDSILKILKSKDKYTQYQCRQRAENHYNKDDRYNDYLNLYKEIIKLK